MDLRWLFVALCVIPLGQAQPPTFELADAPDDLVGTGGTPTTGSAWVDLTTTHLYEDLIGDALVFEYVVAGELPSVDSVSGRYSFYTASFQLGGQHRIVSIEIYAEENRWQAYWGYAAPSEDGLAAPEPLDGGRAEILPGPIVRASVPRETFADDAPINIGTTIQDLHFETYTAQYGNGVAGTRFGVQEAADRAPDQGNIDHTISFHTTTLPNLMIFSQQMVKSSNGGATTIVFPVRVVGNATDVTLRTTGVPSDWDVDLPIDHLPEVSGETVVPLILTARFVHRHGVSELFTVEAETPDGIATALYGIHYLENPQPAGHHSRVWVYAISNGEQTLGATGGTLTNDVSHRGILSARSGHPLADEEPLPASGGAPQAGTTDTTWSWHIPLDPGLRIGLAPDTADLGSFTFSMTRPDGGSATVKAALGLESDEGFVPLFEAEPADVQFTATATDVAVALRALSSDVVPYVPGRNLVLRIDAEGQAPGLGVGPGHALYLQPGAVLDVPLREYHDPILGLLPASNLTFMGGDREVFVQPNSETIHRVQLRNLGETSKRVHVAIQTSDGIQATLAADEFDLAANRGQELQLTVPAPESGSFIVALAASSPDGDIALGRLIFVVDESAPEGERPTPEERRSPTGSVALLAVAVLALVRRRGLQG